MAGLKQSSLALSAVYAALQSAWQSNPGLVEHFAYAVSSPPRSGKFTIYFANGTVTGWEESTHFKDRDFSLEGNGRPVV